MLFLLFSAAYYLRDEGELLQHDRDWLEQLLTWFRSELPIPPAGTIPAQAIFWYGDIGSFSRRMWKLVGLVEKYGFTTEQVTAKFIGRIVYQDRCQPTCRHSGGTRTDENGRGLR